ncbi:MAG: hypothetical protein HY721_29760 [Planctomycetes bacterium]|nr:hypothetical protein [Planctomycetota bacterium]
MGSLQTALRTEYVRRIGEEGWHRHLQAIGEMWSEIESMVYGLSVDFRQVKLYQDGLPVCGKELEIVTDLAQRSSRNHVLLKRLVARGATLVGTESPDLLLEEYKSISAAGKEDGSRPAPSAAADLLRRRDRFIANRIDETLREDETGILFMGLLHRVDEYLPASIEVLPQIARLPLGEAKAARQT